MSQRRFGIAGVGLVIFLLLPRESSAGGADVIWGMSGPQMVGVVLHCRVPVGSEVTQCHVLNRIQADPTAGRNYWIALEGGFYGSTPKDSEDGNDYGWFDVGMLTFEPLLEWRWPGARAVRSGVGFGYNRLFNLWGRDFEALDKFNIKVRMLGIESSGFDLAVNLRIYPNGFTSGDFGFGPRVDIDRKAEAVIGFSVGFPKVGRW